MGFPRREEPQPRLDVPSGGTSAANTGLCRLRRWEEAPRHQEVRSLPWEGPPMPPSGGDATGRGPAAATWNRPPVQPCGERTIANLFSREGLKGQGQNCQFPWLWIKLNIIINIVSPSKFASIGSVFWQSQIFLVVYGKRHIPRVSLSKFCLFGCTMLVWLAPECVWLSSLFRYSDLSLNR